MNNKPLPSGGYIKQPLESRIRLEEIRMLYGSMMFSMLATFAVSLIMFIVLFDHASSRQALIIWFAVMIMSIMLRSWDSYCFINAGTEIQNRELWGKRFLLGSTFSGFWWGMLSWLGHSAESGYQTLIVVSIIGVAGGSLATLSYRWQTIVFFLMPALLLLELRLIFEDTDFFRAVSYMLAVFILFTLTTSRRAYTNSNQNVRLRIEADYNEEALKEAKNEAEQANSSKSAFLSTMSHELRTPLHAILGYAQLLERGKPLSKQQSHNIREIDKAGKLLLELVNEILDLASIEKGNLQLNMTSISLVELIRECKALVQPLADEKHIQIDIQDASCHVHADYTRLKQSILNLLTNSIKYNNESGKVSIKCRQLNNKRVRIDVRDTGYGIDADMQEHLFQPFNRLETGSEIEGSGIGLAITRQLVEKMNGTISVKSVIGEGSTFSIELDSYVSDDSADTVIKTELDNSSYTEINHDVPRKKILLVEDNSVNLKLIEHQIKVLGYQADMAADGIEALKLFRKNNYGLVITDCNMPNMNGYELTSIIRQEDNSNIPVVALTADAFPEKEDKCLAAGMNARLVKPLDMETLENTINQYI
jgi:signal transduction histidine kinase